MATVNRLRNQYNNLKIRLKSYIFKQNSSYLNYYSLKSQRSSSANFLRYFRVYRKVEQLKLLFRKLLNSIVNQTLK